MKKKLLFLIPVAGIVGLTFMSTTNGKVEKYHKDGITTVNKSDNTVAAAKTGAPGEDNCTQCHNSFSVLAADGTNGATTPVVNYQLGTTYTFTMTSTNPENGFQMTILNSDGNKAGDFVAGATNTAIQTSGGREYINHSTKAQSWSYDWVAPATDMGALTAYYTLNATNNNGVTGGDEVYMGTISLPSSISNGLTNYQKQDNKVKMFFNDNANELNVNYSLNEKSNIMVQVVSLSGKVVEEVELGKKSYGPHASKVKFQNIETEGIYVVSLFVNNSIFTRKVYLK